MSNNVVTTAHLQAKSKEARDQLIAIFKEITDNSWENEKEGVIRYITAVPIEAHNETSIYMIEQYKDQAASDAHLQTAPVQKLLQYFGAENPLVVGPEIFNLNPINDFKRPVVEPAPDTLLILAHMGYKEGKMEASRPAFEKLISTCEQTEPGFLACCLCEDKANNTIQVVDIFESDKFYEEVHAKSEAIGKFHQENTALTTGDFGLAKLKIVHGFLGRE